MITLKKTSYSYFHFFAFWVGLSLISVSCTPLSEEEQAYLEQKREQEEQQEQVSSALKGGTRQSEAIEMVKKEDAPDGRGTMLEWVDRQHALSEEKIIFPRWIANGRGNNKFEVIYEYSVIDNDYKSVKKGFSWSVDLVLKIVGSYKEVEDEDEGPQTADQRISHQLLQEQKSTQEFSLE